ncbi:dipeptide ABC transporter ATP-binding protein DppD, partial [Burkholderia pseudomallei]
MGLVGARSRVTPDVVALQGYELLAATQREGRRAIRNEVAVADKGTLTVVRPGYTVGYQITELRMLDEGRRGVALQ